MFVIDSFDTSEKFLTATLSLLTITNGTPGVAEASIAAELFCLSSGALLTATAPLGPIQPDWVAVSSAEAWRRLSTARSPTTGSGWVRRRIFNTGTVILVNTTINGNTAAPALGGGIFNGGGALNMINTIIAGSASGGDCVNAGDLLTNSHNLIQDGSCGPALSGDPKLGPLNPARKRPLFRIFRNGWPISPDLVAGFLRIQWPVWFGFSGRFAPEHAKADDLTTLDFGEFVERCRQWCAEQGVVIPDPGGIKFEGHELNLQTVSIISTGLSPRLFH